MFYELLPFLVMITGILLIGVGAIWLITRQYNQLGEVQIELQSLDEHIRAVMKKHPEFKKLP